jgi:hypothetical protein
MMTLLTAILMVLQMVVMQIVMLLKDGIAKEETIQLLTVATSYVVIAITGDLLNVMILDMILMVVAMIAKLKRDGIAHLTV